MEKKPNDKPEYKPCEACGQKIANDRAPLCCRCQRVADAMERDFERTRKVLRWFERT